MREYRFQATDETVAALRLLRGAWSGLHHSPHGVSIALASGQSVRLQIGDADVEGVFDAFRLDAVAEEQPAVGAVPHASLHMNADVGMTAEGAGDFALGGNDVVLFTGATWSVGGSMSMSGHLGQLPETAEMVCITTDAIVVAATTGNGLLMRTGLKPYTIDVVRERNTISKFLQDRGYESSEPEL